MEIRNDLPHGAARAPVQSIVAWCANSTSRSSRPAPTPCASISTAGRLSGCPDPESGKRRHLQVREATTETFAVTLPEPAWISGAITGSWQQLLADYPTVLMFDADSTLLHEERLLSTPQYRFILPLRGCEDSGRDVGSRAVESAGVISPAPPSMRPGRGGGHGVSLVESGVTCLLEGPARSWVTGRTPALRSAGTPVARARGYRESIFSIANLRPGTYYLYIQKLAWDQPGTPVVRRRGQLATATPITIAGPGEVVAITAHLREVADQRARHARGARLQGCGSASQDGRDRVAEPCHYDDHRPRHV